MNTYEYRGYLVGISRVPIPDLRFNAHVLDAGGTELWADGTFPCETYAADAAQRQVYYLLRAQPLARPGGAMLILRCWVCGAEQRVGDVTAFDRFRLAWTRDGHGWRHVSCEVLTGGRSGELPSIAPVRPAVKMPGREVTM